MISRTLVAISCLLLAACGGASFEGADGSGGAGDSSGGSDNRAGGNSKGGASGKSSGGSSSNGGSSSGGAIDRCATVDCAAPLCNEGTLVTAPGDCCPTCSCETVACALPDCANGEDPIVEPGNCCPTCPNQGDGSCHGVECQPQPPECPEGYIYERPTGACCAGCMPKAVVACLDIACIDPQCPRGYVSAEYYGGCCYDCVPDPLYCAGDQYCLIADRPRPCCGCHEAVSTRLYDEDECWSDVNEPRVIPERCEPQVMCQVLCEPCGSPGEARCVDNHCTQLQ